MAVSSSRSHRELHITEQWIRERLNLQLDSLEDVRSLALTGSYSEKIAYLGRSLLGFTRLKHLDLSRNAIRSLEGLDHLKHLETLNLYYNSVSSLKELFRLKHNVKLTEVDLRLNPVAKNEPDYRLFMVHMLTGLRKLDDRGVRESERKAALMHFDTDQAYELEVGVKREQWRIPTSSSSADLPDHIKARTHLVHSLAPRPTALDDDTDALLDLIARNDDLLSPRQEKHVPHHNRLLRSVHTHHSPPLSPLSHRERNGSAGSSSGSNSPTYGVDEAHAYADYKVKGNFTPAPDRGRGKESHGKATREEEQNHSAGTKSGRPVDSSKENSATVDHLLKLLQESIPECGTISENRLLKEKLHQWLISHAVYSPASWDQLRAELETVQQRLLMKDSIIKQKDVELSTLQQNLQEREKETAAITGQLEQQSKELEDAKLSLRHLPEARQFLQQADSDLSTLRQQLQLLQQENRDLKASIESAPSVSKLQSQIGQLECEAKGLRRELEGAREQHKQDLHNSTQLQELASMLQESHRSLVATNDHLLKELEESKQRHTQELLQMNSNYAHLRKTVDIMQHL